MGSRKKNKAEKTCQFKLFADRFTGKRMVMKCDKKQECAYKGLGICDKHRRILQDQDIEKLKDYQKFEEELDSIALS